MHGKVERYVNTQSRNKISIYIMGSQPVGNYPQVGNLGFSGGELNTL